MGAELCATLRWALRLPRTVMASGAGASAVSEGPLAAWSVLAALVLAASVVARAQKALRAAAATAF
jgi:hypothetical protein